MNVYQYFAFNNIAGIVSAIIGMTTFWICFIVIVLIFHDNDSFWVAIAAAVIVWIITYVICLIRLYSTTKLEVVHVKRNMHAKHQRR